MISANLLAIFYLISGILFILALRGLSSPETSRQGNLFGIIGMAIAITVTFLSIDNFSSGFLYVILFLLIGGSIGAFIAFKIPMTAMPELVAGFHSLVGLAAVFVAISAFISPEVFNLGSAGTGGSNLPNLPAEFSKLPHDRGTIGAARSASPDSANSQFFINFSDNNFLNGQYTVYGRVTSGMEHVDAIVRGEPPHAPDRMISVKVASDL